MDPHQHQNNDLFFWQEDRPMVASPEYFDPNLMFPPTSMEYQPDNNSNNNQGLHRTTLRLSPELCSGAVRGPLLSPSGPVGHHHGFNSLPPGYQQFLKFMPPYPSAGAAPPLMSASKASSSASSPIQNRAFAIAPPAAEDAPSTDATPESSDVEDEGERSGGRSSKRNKRAKKMISDTVNIEHNEQAKQFPYLLESLRRRLLIESPDGTIQESAALSALIGEFTKGAVTAKYTLPYECEIWLKRAAEDVNEQRMAAKGAKKSKAPMVSSETGERMFYCTYCAEQGEHKPFKTQEGLSLHVRNKHDKDKKWVCHAPDCSVSFVRQADLRMHLIRMHAPVRPFPCGVPFCLKSFAGVSELRRHVKVDHYKHIRELCASPARTSSSAGVGHHHQ